MIMPTVTVKNSDNYKFDNSSYKNGKKTEKLSENRQGIILPSPFGELLYTNSNNEDLVLYLPKQYKSEIGKPKYVLEDGVCYGIIKLGQPEKRQIQNIENGLVSQEDIKKWWDNKEVVFEYPISIVKMFEEPLKVDYDMTDTFVQTFNYEDSDETVSSYMKDLKILVSKYSYYKNKNNQKIDNIIKNTRKTCKKLRELGVDTKSMNFSNVGQELMDKTKNRAICNSVDEVWETFDETTVIPNFVNISMSDDKMEVRFKSHAPDGKTRQLIESKVSEIFPDWDRLSFVWGVENSQENSVPLFNLKLEKAGEEIITENKEVYETLQKTDFIELQELEDLNQVNYNQDMLAFEPKKLGRRLFIGKTNDSVLILNKYGEDVTDKYDEEILQSFSELSNKNYILECTEYNNKFYVYDCLFFKEDMRDKPWFERKQKLNNLNFNNNIEEVSSVIVSNEKDAETAQRLLSSLDNTVGILVKPYNSKYTDKTWYSIDNLEGATTTSSPGVSSVRGKTWKKKVIKPSDYYASPQTKKR